MGNPFTQEIPDILNNFIDTFVYVFSFGKYKSIEQRIWISLKARLLNICLFLRINITFMVCFLDKLLLCLLVLIKFIHFPKIFCCICFFVHLILYYTKYKASCVCVFLLLPHLTNQRNVTVSSSTGSIYVHLKLDHLKWWVFKKLYVVNFFLLCSFWLTVKSANALQGFF